MEFSCKHLQGLLERLNKDKKICTWTSHTNEFDQTTVMIRFKPPKIPKSTNTRGSAVLAPSTPEIEAEKDTSGNRFNSKTSERLSSEFNTRDSHDSDRQSEEPQDQLLAACSGSSLGLGAKSKLPICDRVVFKPASNYQLKRDKERLQNFRSKYQTRASKKQRETSPVEIKRSRDVVSDEVPCLSPASPLSPFADHNPFSPLVDTGSSPALPSSGDSTLSAGSSLEQEDIYEAPLSSQPHSTPDVPTAASAAAEPALTPTTVSNSSFASMMTSYVQHLVKNTYSAEEQELYRRGDFKELMRLKTIQTLDIIKKHQQNDPHGQDERDDSIT